ncbi:MAG: hypothetical protein JW720_00290 [Sedimentisphaerales bacterium]|nr:hypothetical protein [Sedimentisphaerales bacterium]
MRITITILTLAVLCSLAGCAGSEKGSSIKDDDILTVNFEQDKAIQYRFVSKREVTIEWDPEQKMSRSGRNSIERLSESTDIVMEYVPIEVDPFGLTTIKATCKSAKVSRSKRPAGAASKDAAEYFEGMSYTLKIGPTAKIEDYSELDAVIKQLGEKAFRANSNRGRIKEPDMISDIIATQWFLWDSVSSIDINSDAPVPGQSWKSQLSVSGPMVMRKARDVVYTLKEIRPSKNGRTAVINSVYAPAQSVPDSWPIPYSGSFQMSGTFGFLSGYKMLGLEGEGQELFNMDTGQLEQYNQKYQMKLSAMIPLGISAKPQISINQTITATKL